ncbi:hypothetical protein ADUPG1_013009 [Aduncisulcus paluster]|uniref:Uncharacterized protein n=1 Tax=Aduncisulcus paluster TaxID=2918883 RepID=A0ABQ5K373_9EUKA|nr:hypothetical protein ADUPG1_013009 [Aduncisulcus paluster]
MGDNYQVTFYYLGWISTIAWAISSSCFVVVTLIRKSFVKGTSIAHYCLHLYAYFLYSIYSLLGYLNVGDVGDVVFVYSFDLTNSLLTMFFSGINILIYLKYRPDKTEKIADVPFKMIYITAIIAAALFLLHVVIWDTPDWIGPVEALGTIKVVVISYHWYYFGVTRSKKKEQPETPYNNTANHICIVAYCFSTVGSVCLFAQMIVAAIGDGNVWEMFGNIPKLLTTLFSVGFNVFMIKIHLKMKLEYNRCAEATHLIPTESANISSTTRIEGV